MAATISLNPPSSEQSVEEKLFEAVIYGHLSQFEEMLEDLNDIDVRFGDGKTTLLHAAVKMGKADWVEGLLGKGADPGINSEDGVSPAKLAEENAEEHHGDGDRQLIWKYIRMVQRRDSVMHGHPSAGSAATAATAGNLHETIHAVKHSVEALHADMPTFRREVTLMTMAVGEIRAAMIDREAKLEGLHGVLTSSVNQMEALKEKLVEINLISR